MRNAYRSSLTIIDVNKRNSVSMIDNNKRSEHSKIKSLELKNLLQDSNKILIYEEF
jgi:hypothetical protein